MVPFTAFDRPNLPFRDNVSGALSWLLSQPENHTAALEAVYRQLAIPVRTLGQGVLLRYRDSDDYLLSAGSGSALTLLLMSLPERVNTLLLHQGDFVPPVAQALGDGRAQTLSLWKYPYPEQPPFDLPFEVWPLDLGDVQDALTFDPTLPVEEFSRQIQERRVFGACIRDRLAGTVGIAPGGGIDWLAVPPELRGQGIGVTLLRWMLRRELRCGHVPYTLLPEGSALTPMLEGVGFVKTQPDLILFSKEKENIT